MSNATIQKRGKYYQYKFETAKIDGKRNFARNFYEDDELINEI